MSTRALLLLLTLSSLVSAADFSQCFLTFTNDPNATGGVDPQGHVTADPAEVAGLTFRTCEKYCGPTADVYSVGEFAESFSSWLIPWLALISELPFDSGNYNDDFISAVLSVGSPALVAYSLALTSLNTRLVYRRAKHVQHKDKTVVARALISLRQAPLELTKDERLLASIPTNSRWAQEIVGRLNRRNAWPIATLGGIGWVVVVSLIAFFGSVFSGASDGHTVVTLWSWLPCLVIARLWVPTFFYADIKATLRRANQKAAKKTIKGLRQTKEKMRPTKINRLEESNAPVDAITGPLEVNEEEREQSIQEGERQAGREIGQNAKPLPSPSNYRPLLPFQPSPEIEGNRDHPDPIANGVDGFTRRPIDPESDELLVHRPFDPLNRDAFRHTAAFNFSRAIPYLILVDDIFKALDGLSHEITAQSRNTVVFPKGALASMFTASILALVLQCGTTAAATMVSVSTQTFGVGCDSSGYMLYGGLAIIIMFLSITSTIFSRISETRAMTSTTIKGFTAFIAITLRRLSLSLAFINAAGLILLHCFQFSGYLNTCYCNAKVISRGTDSYAFLLHLYYSGPMLDETMKFRIFSIIVCIASMAIYMVFLRLVSTLPAEVDDF